MPKLVDNNNDTIIFTSMVTYKHKNLIII